MNKWGIACVLFVAASLMALPVAWATPLDDYVNAQDAAYSYDLLATYPHGAYTDYVFHLVSQNWLTTAEVDRTLWEHHLVITVPATVNSGTALLYIVGGNTTSPVPTSNDPMLVQMALDTNSVTALLRQIPNQPLTFAADPSHLPRTEDAEIAFCWKQFLLSGESKWLSRLPMTKAAVRAMDTVTNFMATPTAGSKTVNQFVVTGASKRGWTTWTTAAVDTRVIAFAPMVIDLLNLQISFRHHFDVYGFWSPAIQDYTDQGIPDWFQTPEFKALTDIVEPYSYRARFLNKPKFLINGSQDEFFIPDSSQFYWNRLPGEKRIRYVPSAGHSLGSSAPDENPADDLRAWYWAILNGVARPDITWTKKGDGSLDIQVVSGTPSQVLLWQATNPTARNFMTVALPSGYSSSTLAPSDPNHYVASVPVPPSGWTAFFVEFTFPSGGPTPFRFTTEVSVVPDVLPYGPHYQLGTETELLDASFYAGQTDDGSNVAGRMAFFGAASNDATRVAFWGVNANTFESAFFVVDVGDPSSWRRITADIAQTPDAPICWSPDGSALLVGSFRIAIPPAGQVSPLQPVTNHGYAYDDASTTALAGNNWAVGLINSPPGKNIIALPILADATEDLSRPAVILTDFTASGLEADWPAVSADGKSIAFADYHGTGVLGVSADVSNCYALNGVDELLAAGKRTGTDISNLAPTSAADEKLVPIRTTESDNFAHTPMFSQDKSIVLFSEDWNNAFTDDAFFESMGLADFDIMVANGDGFEADQRLEQSLNQSTPVPTRGGTRILYLRQVGGAMHLMITTLEVKRTISGTSIGNNDIVVTATQKASDGSGTTVAVAEGTTVDFPNAAPQEVQITTPTDPITPAQLIPAVNAIPVVRDFGPDGTNFSPAINITMTYTDQEIVGLDESNLAPYLYNPGTGKFDTPVTVVSRDLANNTITFAVDHFSTYGLGGAKSATDSDNDGLTDFDEVHTYNTNPNNADSDGDGLPDGWEVAYSLNPLDDGTVDSENGANGDPDGDTYSNLAEYLGNSNPQDIFDFPPASVPVDTIALLVALFATLAVVGRIRTVRS